MDEIGEIPLSIQGRFLRLLESGRFRRVGGREDLEIDIRVVCSTHNNLRKMVDKGTFRVFMPLTHIGRVCPVDTSVHGVPVKAGGRVSLCWASANFDETVFDAPEEVQLDRKPNPHLSFGAGAHLCLGAPHARLIVRSLLQALTDRVASIQILGAEEHIEDEARYRRSVGYDSLTIRFTGADAR